MHVSAGTDASLMCWARRLLLLLHSLHGQPPHPWLDRLPAGTQATATTQFQAPLVKFAPCRNILLPSLGQCQQLEELRVSGHPLWEVTGAAWSLTWFTSLMVISVVESEESQVGTLGYHGMGHAQLFAQIVQPSSTTMPAAPRRGPVARVFLPRHAIQRPGGLPAHWPADTLSHVQKVAAGAATHPTLALPKFVSELTPTHPPYPPQPACLALLPPPCLAGAAARPLPGWAKAA